MAEIKIEKKRPVWPWVLLVIIALGLILFFAFFYNSTDDDVMDNTDTEETDDVQTSLDEMEDVGGWDDTDSLKQNNEAYESAGLTALASDESRLVTDTAYTQNAFRQLLNLIQVKAAEKSFKATSQLQELRTEVDSLNENYTASVQDVSTGIADLLKELQTQKFPQLANETTEVKKAAGDINSAATNEEKASKLNHFFDETSKLLEKMN